MSLVQDRSTHNRRRRSLAALCVAECDLAAVFQPNALTHTHRHTRIEYLEHRRLASIQSCSWSASESHVWWPAPFGRCDRSEKLINYLENFIGWRRHIAVDGGDDRSQHDTHVFILHFGEFIGSYFSCETLNWLGTDDRTCRHIARRPTSTHTSVCGVRSHASESNATFMKPENNGFRRDSLVFGAI